MTEYTMNNTYELAYLLLPGLSEDEAVKAAENMSAMVTKTGATEVLSNGGPRFIDLEYDMTKRIDTKNEKFEQAYFGWVKYQAETTSVEALKEELDHVGEVLRYMVVKTETDNELTDVFSVEEAVESEESIMAEAEVETEAEQEKAAVEASKASGEGEKDEVVEEKAKPTEDTEGAKEGEEGEKEESTEEAEEKSEKDEEVVDEEKKEEVKE